MEESVRSAAHPRIPAHSLAPGLVALSGDPLSLPPGRNGGDGIMQIESRAAQLSVMSV
jgi:hypothetical protein